MDFFRNFTVDVVGVGDVCSFAQMDVRQSCNEDSSKFVGEVYVMDLLYRGMAT